jgi:hypothetical protein
MPYPPRRPPDPDGLDELVRARMRANIVPGLGATAKPAAAPAGQPDIGARSRAFDTLYQQETGAQLHSMAPLPTGVPNAGGQLAGGVNRATGGQALNPRPDLPPTPAAPAPVDPNQAAKDAAKQKAHQATVDQQDGVAGLSPEDQAYYRAQKQDLEAKAARDQQATAQRAGLGGLGLLGASATLGADTARQDARNETLALGDLRGQLGTQEFNQQQRAAALDALESETNTDYNGDGKIAGDVGSGPDATGVTDHAVSGDERTALASYFHMENIKDGTFTKGDTYMGSDNAYDYYQKNDGSLGFYRVHR